ncbi:hypothetical protein VIGAN_08244400 [Vigna angularis var. angularis]|uniref:Uncharacterized protein n=1 Tax=Vigna angularis var. angularis TaxID=157739 RepID=A0A0S3SS74_PHAAN|nr:hypothetical protein VIGAN_08244400 [Vigna angularis var. angularis]
MATVVMSMMPNCDTVSCCSIFSCVIKVSLCLEGYVMETKDLTWGLWQKGFGFIVPLEVNFGCGKLCFFLIEETCYLLSYWTSQ